MKKKTSFLLIELCLLGLVGCNNKKTTNVSIHYEGDDAQVSFAVNDIKNALKENGYHVVNEGADYTIDFQGLEESLGEQNYSVSVERKDIALKGGDVTGLMYAGLDLAEQIEAEDISQIASKTVRHDIDFRGLKFNAPLDMRTPSYSDGGDSGQSNILTMWDKSFWQEEFDAMARDRFNALSLWNLNPFPSMIKLEDYPDVALDDVWKTTLYFDDSYNGTASDLVRPEHFQEGNYEVIKKITIDEKIAYWKDIMKMAHDRGIRFYIYTWNVYTFGEQGKYGITADQDNEVTKDYYTKSVEKLIDTYPDLDGLGFGAGENMKASEGSSSSSDGASVSGDEENEIWLHDTYGTGIKKALAKTPERDFEVIHRMHFADGRSLAKIWGDIPCKFNLSDKYSIAHMYSAEKPEYVKDTLDNREQGQKLWLELRNDDSFFLRYGGTRFLRSLISQMPEGIKGFLMGSDGYIQGREYTSTNEQENGELYLEKHWYNYLLCGRLGYQNNLEDDFFRSRLAARYQLDSEKTKALFDLLNAGGEILPNSNMLFFVSIDSWYPEGSWNNPNTFGYLTIKRLLNNSTVHPYGNVISIAEYCKNLENSQSTEKRTPLDIITALNESAGKVISLQKESFADLDSLDYSLGQIIQDQLDFASLGKYYAEKYQAAIDLRLFNDTKEEAKRTSAVEHATKASEYFDTYADDMIARYGDKHRLSRAGIFSFSEVKKDVKDDISFCQKYKPRKLS